MVSLRVLLIALLTLPILGCGSGDEMSDAEREAFRQELIDKALNDEVRKMGNEFLVSNKASADVVERASGLQYRVLSEGSGAKPTLDKVVEVAFEGRRVDGVVIDKASEDKPARFPLKQVIRGWREGVPLMREGAEWEFYIPADLAYGATSPSVDIPANSTLIFRIKLLKILESGAKES